MSKPSQDFDASLLDNLYDGVYFVDTDRQITYWNKGAERLTGHSADDVTGSRCSDNLLRHITKDGESLCQGVCPLAQSILDGKDREAEVYLHHKEGYRVPVLVRTMPIRDAADKIIGGVEIFSDNAALASMRKRIVELEELALVDHLTQAGNRRYSEMIIQSRIEEAKRYGWQFGLLFIDIDHFKHINDTLGHKQGDEVLTMVGKTIMLGTRRGDCVGRWGGEEFVVVAANANEKQLYRVAERIRMLVEKSSVMSGAEVIQVTVSIGATVGRVTDKVDSVIRRADQLMYRSKVSGRNRVTIDSDKGLLATSLW